MLSANLHDTADGSLAVGKLTIDGPLVEGLIPDGPYVSWPQVPPWLGTYGACPLAVGDWLWCPLPMESWPVMPPCCGEQADDAPLLLGAG